MPPSSKTFLRQKSYTINQKDRLRYAIHLNLYNNRKRHLFLCGTLRVVFSPKSPDIDEKMRVVTLGPDNPKYICIDSDEALQVEKHGR